MAGARDKNPKNVTVRCVRLQSFALPGTFETEDAVPQAPLQVLPPSLSSMSKTLHPCKVIACCVVKCFSMLDAFPLFDVIKALHVLQLALVLSFLVKYNQTSASKPCWKHYEPKYKACT